MSPDGGKTFVDETIPETERHAARKTKLLVWGVENLLGLDREAEKGSVLLKLCYRLCGSFRMASMGTYEI